MYEQSPEYFKQFRRRFKFFFLNNEPDVSDLSSNTNFAFAVQSNQKDFCYQSLANGQPHYHVLIEFAKKCLEAANEMILKSFFVPCPLSSFKNLIMGYSKNRLSGPLIIRLTTLTPPEFPCENDCNRFVFHHRLDPFKLRLI